MRVSIYRDNITTEVKNWLVHFYLGVIIISEVVIFLGYFLTTDNNNIEYSGVTCIVQISLIEKFRIFMRCSHKITISRVVLGDCDFRDILCATDLKYYVYLFSR